MTQFDNDAPTLQEYYPASLPEVVVEDHTELNVVILPWSSSEVGRGVMLQPKAEAELRVTKDRK
jgi:hypothetical protein